MQAAKVALEQAEMSAVVAATECMNMQKASFMENCALRHTVNATSCVTISLQQSLCFALRRCSGWHVAFVLLCNIYMCTCTMNHCSWVADL